MSIEVSNVTFGYKESDRKVLAKFSANFAYGEIAALTGSNGAGKTTLARIIMGILKPEQGDITVDGKNINEYTLAQRGCLIGYAMQNPARQIFSTTVEEEMEYGLRNMKLSEQEIKERIDEYLRYFGMEQHRQSFPFTLSHGEKQRLVLAAILAMKPKYLILDEPTASLDIKRKKALGQLLGGIKCGCIIISHDTDFVNTYCHKIVRLECGHE